MAARFFAYVQGVKGAGGMAAGGVKGQSPTTYKNEAKKTEMSNGFTTGFGAAPPPKDFYASAFPNADKPSAKPVQKPKQDDPQKAWGEIFAKNPVMVFAEYAKMQGGKKQEEKAVPKQKTKTKAYETPWMTDAVTKYNEETDAEINTGYQKIDETKKEIGKAQTEADDKRHDPELAAMEAQEIATQLMNAPPGYAETPEGQALIKKHEEAMKRSQDLNGAREASDAAGKKAEQAKGVLNDERNKVYNAKAEQKIVNTTALAVETKQTNPEAFTETAKRGAGNPVEKELSEQTNRQNDSEATKQVALIDQEKAQLEQQLAANPQYLQTAEGQKQLARIDELSEKRKEVVKSVSKWAIMPEEDKETLRWIYATEGEAAARAYYDAHEQIYTVMDFQKAMDRNLGAYQNENPTDAQRIAAGVNSVLYSPGKFTSYVGNAANAIENTFSGEENWKPVNLYGGAYDTALTTQALREYATKDLSKQETFLANLAMSGGEMLLALPFNVFAPAIMGANQAGDSTLNALQNGATAEEAFAYGTVSGVTSAMLEKIPVDHLFAIKNIATEGSKAGVKETVKRIGKQAMLEGTEEMSEEVIDIIADVSLLKNKGEVAQYIDEYVKDNPNATKAEQNAAMALYFVNRMAQAYMGGTIMGGAFGGGAETIGRLARDGSYDADTEKTMRDTPRLDGMLGKDVMDGIAGKGKEISPMTRGIAETEAVSPVAGRSKGADTPMLDGLLGAETMRALKAGVDSVGAD